MKKALFPGTFDPPTLGHLNIIQRAETLFDKLYIGIAQNSTKKNQLFSIEEKKKLLKTLIPQNSNIEIVSFSGLVVDYAQTQNINCLIRGIRTFSDFEFESEMASANKKMTGIETLFLMADTQLAHISSTLIREIASNGRRLHQFIPVAIEEIVFKKLSSA